MIEDMPTVRRPVCRTSFSGSWALRLVPVGPTLEELAQHVHEVSSSSKSACGSPFAGVTRTSSARCSTRYGILFLSGTKRGRPRYREPFRAGTKSPEALLILQAEALGPSVAVSITDDGKGIDPQVVREAAISRGIISADNALLLSDQDC